jgi:hypothetical protein
MDLAWAVGASVSVRDVMGRLSEIQDVGPVALSAPHLTHRLLLRWMITATSYSRRSKRRRRPGLWAAKEGHKAAEAIRHALLINPGGEPIVVSKTQRIG